ncbi:hypothetical protein O3M35_007125 [Rhynocoris fuscipes]|uniref:C2H2-type domain-containing protein n=1 Tax=Rhynocoris fuscipes TaxID=488301 RepID=A0AAW1DAW4_9HEMI
MAMMDQSVEIVRNKKQDSDDCSRRLFTCKYCGSVYTQKTNLYRHIRQIHKSKGCLTLEQVPDYYSCTSCQCKFKTKSLLSFHEALLHPIRKGKLVIPCPVCEFSASKAELLAHYRDKHNVEIIIEEHNFKKALDFYLWKSNVERSTRTQYAKRQKHHVLVNGVIIDILYCHRDGFYRPEGRNLRCAKLKGTNKINGYCPAFMRVMTYADDRVSVLFLKSHFGHDYEIDRLALTKSERDSVASKIALGLPFDTILTELQCSKQERLRIITKKDLYNIEVSYNLSSLRERHVKCGNINVQHKDALEVPASYITVENNRWIIRSMSRQSVTYTVEPLTPDCDIDKCMLRCKLCECCGHYYRCSCTEQIPLVLMCKHKHIAHLTIKDSQVIIQADCRLTHPAQNNHCEQVLVSHPLATSSLAGITGTHPIPEPNIGQQQHQLLMDNCPPITTLVIQDLPNDTATLFVSANNEIDARKAAIRNQLADILQVVETSDIEEELHLIQSLLEPITQTIDSMKEPEEIVIPEAVQPACKQIRLDDETAAQYFSSATGITDSDTDNNIVVNPTLQSSVIDHQNNSILITYTLNQDTP